MLILRSYILSSKYFKKIFLLFFQHIVDINSLSDDILYFVCKIAKMPVKSAKNPFAFLQKSDYNVRQTVI